MAFSREELKRNAKELLKNNYWNIFVAILIIGLPSAIIRSIAKTKNFGTISILYGLTSFILSILILPALEVGIIKYLMSIKRGNNADLSIIFSVFESRNYFNVIKIMFFRNLYLFGWSLLFLIPGIVKSYEYKFIPYLLAENMGMGREEVFRLSQVHTRNRKLDIFVLDLSFIGWYILGFMAFGIGVVFVAPYHHAVNMELFEKLSSTDIGYL